MAGIFFFVVVVLLEISVTFDPVFQAKILGIILDSSFPLVSSVGQNLSLTLFGDAPRERAAPRGPASALRRAALPFPVAGRPALACRVPVLRLWFCQTETKAAPSCEKHVIVGV